MASSLGSSFFAQWAGCQKLHVIPLAIDSHCASDSGAENFGPCEIRVSKKANIF